MKLILKTDFAFDCKVIEIGRDGDVGAVEVVGDFRLAGERFTAVRFEFTDMYGKRTRTKTYELSEDRTVRFVLPAEVTDTVGLVEMQAVLTGQGIVRKSNIVTLEVGESLNGEDAEVVGGSGEYCPLLRFALDGNGYLTLTSTDESGVVGTDFSDGTLIVDFPRRYAVKGMRKTETGRAELEITLEEER